MKGKEKKKIKLHSTFLSVIMLELFAINGVYKISSVHLGQVIASTCISLPYHEGSFPLW